MRESHLEQIERWAHFVKENPTAWKRSHTLFINALFLKNKQFLERLRKTPQGEEKIRQLYRLQ